MGVVIPSPTSVIKGRPTQRRQLSAQFMIGDTAQNIFPPMAGTPRASRSRRRKACPIQEPQTIPVDDEHIEKETGRIKRRFNDTFQ